MIALDLSRLLSRAGRGAPTGIDRVELAYAEHLIAAEPAAGFAALSPLGGIGLVPRAWAVEYVAALGAVWRGEPIRAGRPSLRRLAGRTRLALSMSGERALVAALRNSARPVYLLASHHHLERAAPIARLKARSRARFICLLHDLIPLEFPEYARRRQDDTHRRRIATAARHADAIIVGSRATQQSLQPHLDRAGRMPPVLVAPFGLSLPLPSRDAEARPDRPYFVCLGTIEPRKNHLLLLNIWRQLAAERLPSVPRLLLIGRRGWEAESIFAMLDRCPALCGIVTEYSELPDSGMMRLLAGARALLLPSFAEGFGFPLIEALARRVPVVCSDIAALREIGGEVPDYLDPLDSPAWRAAILDYSAPASPRRAAQLARMAGWQPPLWPDHFTALGRLIADTDKSVLR